MQSNDDCNEFIGQLEKMEDDLAAKFKTKQSNLLDFIVKL